MKILLALFTFCLVASPTFGAIKYQAIQNDQNVTQFSINEGHVIQIPNHQRTVKAASLRLSFHPAAVEKVEKTNTTSWKFTFDDKSFAEISILNPLNFTEYSLIWHGNSVEKDREVCVHYGFNAAAWYSGYQSNDSHWPMNTKTLLKRSQFNYVFELERNSNPQLYHREFEFILEHLWVNSDGFALGLDPHQPLYIRCDPNGADPVMCFSVYTKEYIDGRFYLRNSHDPTYHDIRLRLFSGSNIRTVTDYVVHGSKYIPKPTALPDERFFRYPTFHAGSSEAQSLSTGIVTHGFSNQSEILLTNFGWINYSHNYSVNANFSSLSTNLHSKGLRVGVVLGRPDLMKDHEPEKHLIEYDRFGNALRMIDLTLPEAAQYYQDSLRRIQKDYKIDSFLLRSFILYDLHYNDTEYRRYPNMFATKYIEAAAHAFPASNVTILAEFGFKTQHLPSITRMINYFPVSDGQLLRELIPDVLSLSIAGYSFLQPYSIGGFNFLVKPTDEEMIRWVQATALLPSMSFTRYPWDFSANVLSITKKFVDLHTEHAQTIIQLAKNRVQNGHPIVRPLWYVSPEDIKAYTIGDQFMLGDDILVAPVVAHGQRERTVYLITGSWIDQHGKSYQGPGEFKVAAPLEELPYFKRKI